MASGHSGEAALHMNRMNEYASSGTYYFRRAEEMLAAFDHVRTQDFQVGGEYYVSLAYKAA